METNIKVVGWLHIVMSIFWLLAGAALLIIIVGAGLISGESDAIIITGIVGILIGGLMTLLAIPGIIAGVGLLRFKSWARVLALILAVLKLPGFPLGTVLSLYTIFSLVNHDAGKVFSGTYR